MRELPLSVYGYAVVLEDRCQVLQRTWRERILSWPWRPWVKTKLGDPLVPPGQILKTENPPRMIMDSSTWNEFQKSLL
jgi:hypothetical protein